MVFKIKTSKRTMEIFERINAAEHLQPFILSKLAISLSLNSDNLLNLNDFNTDSLGLELNRQTITGEYDNLFKSLIEMREGRHIDESEYFSKYLKAHLDRGAIMLESEYKYSGDFLTHLISEDKGI